MLDTERRDPRAPGDRRMYLYFNYSESGSLRWYVKVSRKGRRSGSESNTERRHLTQPTRPQSPASEESCACAASNPI